MTKQTASLFQLKWKQLADWRYGRLSMFLEWQRGVYGFGFVLDALPDGWDGWELTVQIWRYQFIVYFDKE